ncbi:MAG: LacI family DNA-binding transcriptional regulator [Spirochaetia bacterium]|jgi:LacI family transcriptional regulator
MARRREKEPPAPVTLRDITKVTGFTVNTVSRALKGKEDISVGTRRFIQREARRLGYIPNALAASLRSGRTGSISAIIPDISDPLFAILLRDIESRLKEKNFDLFIQNTDENDDLEHRAVMASVSKKLDGVVICPCQKDTTPLQVMEGNNVPFVLLGRRFARNAYSYVVADDVKGGFLATRHLIERGHRDILFLNAPTCISSARERLQGYRKALGAVGIPFRTQMVREVAIRGGECSRTLQQLLRNKVRFSAIFCFSDLMAWEAISFLQEKGMKIPGDVAIVGFDDIQSRLFYPYPLTSVGYGKKEIALKAVDSLLRMIERPFDGVPTRLVVDVQLSVRQST